MEGEKQGRLGNLDEMTVPQLQELLDRQKKLLYKKQILRTLPDGGQKVKDFAAKLQHMISERQKHYPPHTNSQTTAPGKQHITEQGRRSASRQARNTQSGTDSDSASSESESVVQGNGEVMDPTVALSDAIDSLVLSEMAASRMTEKSSDCPANGGNLETCFPNSYANIMKKNETSETKRVPFKPNRSLKISDLNDLPDEYKYKSKSSGSGPTSSTMVIQPVNSPTVGHQKVAVKVQEESAVRGPTYKFKGAIEIPIEESIVLQRQQKEQSEKLQALQAAERLAERLHIKTDDYTPSALDMEYRNTLEGEDGDVCDSDDCTDEENDMPD